LVRHLAIAPFDTKNMIMAAAIKIIVLMGVKEHVALYSNRQGLLASELGINVLTAAILNMTITT
jgi:hypothetical protein